MANSPTTEKVIPYALLGMTAVTGLVDAVKVLSFEICPHKKSISIRRTSEFQSSSPRCTDGILAIIAHLCNTAAELQEEGLGVLGVARNQEHRRI
jgi:hypothetical protein